MSQTVDGLARPAAFFNGVRGQLWPRLLPLQVSGCEALLAAMRGWPLSWTAYGLATAYHETSYTMQPIRERGVGDRDGDGEDDWFEKYDTGPLAARLGNTPADDNDGGLFCGRGYPQLTGRGNYAKATARLRTAGFDVDLVANPDLAMRPDLAAFIMRSGMEEGWYTGRGLPDYLPRAGQATFAQFIPARRVINGQDRARDIAGYARAFQAALVAGGWP